MSCKKQLVLLIRDLEFYCVSYPSRKNRTSYLIWVTRKLVAGIICSRDFRLNILLRTSLSRAFLLSRLADTLIFYLYGSTISPNAQLNCRLRFCHARAIVIGPRVIMNGEFVYMFNNVTIGKLIPGTPKKAGDMPQFMKSAVFGVGSSVLGPLRAAHDIVFSSNSFCSLRLIDSDTTVFSHNQTKPGVFFSRSNPECQPFVFTAPKWAQMRQKR
jgi:serine acetyltransferase